MIRRLFAFVVVVAAVAAVGVAVVPGAGAVQAISAKALTDHECDATEWHFVINQLDDPSDAPATIHVEWANGNDEDVPLDTVTPGGVAHYVTTANLDSTVTSATADIVDSWDGQFNLSHGPCNETTTTTTTTSTTSPPTVQTLPVTTTTVPPTVQTLPVVPTVTPPIVVQPTLTG